MVNKILEVIYTLAPFLLQLSHSLSFSDHNNPTSFGDELMAASISSSIGCKFAATVCPWRTESALFLCLWEHSS